MKNLKLKRYDYNQSMKISKSSKLHDYFRSEYKNELDCNEDVFVKIETKRLDLQSIKEMIIELKSLMGVHPSRTISLGSDMHSYILAEYRENSPVKDYKGNYILGDEFVKRL
jgi:hypothetical protein